MTKNGFISKLMGLCLILFVLSAHIFGGVNTISKVDAPKSKTEKNQNKEEEKEQSTSVYAQLDHVVVVPSHDFHFDQILFQALTHTLQAPEKCILYIKNSSLLFQNSFFENIFEVLIAINAP